MSIRRVFTTLAVLIFGLAAGFVALPSAQAQTADRAAKVETALTAISTAPALRADLPKVTAGRGVVDAYYYVRRYYYHPHYYHRYYYHPYYHRYRYYHRY